MKVFKLMLIVALFLEPLVMRAQSDPDPAPPDPAVAPPEAVIAQQYSDVVPPPGKAVVRIRSGSGQRVVTGGPVGFETMAAPDFGQGLGAWWKNSEIVSKLQLTDEQVKKVSQTYLDHKLKLIDLQADLEKQELRLQPLMDIDQPDESKVGAQIDLITAAHGRLEKENAMMMLAIRRWLSVEQWKKLKSLEGTELGPRGVVLVRGNEVHKGARIIKEGPPAPLPEDMPVDVH